eukprot:422735-Rhodomonas_salina.1
MEASGDVNIVAVQLWHAVAIGWYRDNAWEANPNVYTFTELKLNVAQQLSHFKSAKRPKLTPIAPPRVALNAFEHGYTATDRDVHDRAYSFALQAISDAANTGENSKCFNCHEFGHIHPNCPHPTVHSPSSSTPRFARRSGRGAALGGRGAAGVTSRVGGMGTALGGRGTAGATSRVCGMGAALGGRGAAGATS